MTTQINQLTELTTTSDGDLLLIRENATGVDKKMQASNLRAKATTKGDVGLGDVDNVSAANLRDRSTHTGTQTLSTISDSGTMASQNANSVNIDGGTIDGTAVNATNLAYTGTLTGGTGVVNLGSGQVVKDASGNVGIGTTAPNTKLYVASSAAASVPSAGGASSHLAVGETDYGTMIGTLGTGDGYIQQQRFNGVADTFNLLLQPNGGNVNLTGGGNLILSNGAGIDFSAHPNAAGMTSELLDDYEEGTFTFTLSDSDGNNATMGSGNLFRYIKIGTKVTISGTMEWTSIASLTAGSRIRLTGLPFTAQAVTHMRWPATLGSSLSGTFNIPREQIAFGADAGNSFIFGVNVTGNNVDGSLIPADLGSSGTIFGFQLTYFSA